MHAPTNIVSFVFVVQKRKWSATKKIFKNCLLLHIVMTDMRRAHTCLRVATAAGDMRRGANVDIVANDDAAEHQTPLHDAGALRREGER